MHKNHKVLACRASSRDPKRLVSGLFPSFCGVFAMANQSWLIDASLPSLPPSPHGFPPSDSLLTIFKTPFSYKDTSHWIKVSYWSSTNSAAVSHLSKTSAAFLESSYKVLFSFRLVRSTTPSKEYNHLAHGTEL